MESNLLSHMQSIAGLGSGHVDREKAEKNPCTQCRGTGRVCPNYGRYECRCAISDTAECHICDGYGYAVEVA